MKDIIRDTMHGFRFHTDLCGIGERWGFLPFGCEKSLFSCVSKWGGVCDGRSHLPTSALP